MVMGGMIELSAQAGGAIWLWALAGVAALGAAMVTARALIHAARALDLDFEFGYDASASAISGPRLVIVR